MRKRNEIRFYLIAVATGLLVAAGCSLGGQSAPGTPVVMTGTMTKGSVIVNGVHFEVGAGTLISVDDESGRTEVELDDGMTVTLKGEINPDGVTGTAVKVESEDELQGQVQAVTDFSLTVLDQLVYADDRTSYGNVTGLSGIALLDYVEVHGQRDAEGNIRATRIELLSGTPEVELKGRVSNLTGSSFTIWGLAVSYAAGVIEPAGSSLSEGDLVEVAGSYSGGTLTAIRVELEDLTSDPDFSVSEGGDLEIEGYISGFSVHPGSFFVNGEEVITTSATVFYNGSEADLADNIKVEVEGEMSGGSFLVEELEFDRTRIELSGEVGAVGTDTLTLLGIEVSVNDLTETVLVLDAPLVGSRVQVEGYRADGGGLVAESIEDAGGSTEDLLQARVESKSGDPDWNVTLMGLTVNLGGADFEDDADAPLERSEFFGLLEAAADGGTLISVEGSFNGTDTLTAVKAELES
jgi:hypothetical protein